MIVPVTRIGAWANFALTYAMSANAAAFASSSSQGNGLATGVFMPSAHRSSGACAWHLCSATEPLAMYWTTSCVFLRIS